MALIPKVILSDIRAFALAPGDVLVIHADKLNAEQREELEQTVKLALWGKPNTYMILVGNTKIGKITKQEQPG